jgi:hypothetical protein
MKKTDFREITRPYDKDQKPKALTPSTLNSEKEHTRLKKLLKHKTENIDNTLKVAFTQPDEKMGWIYLTIATVKISIQIRCSYAFEPFDDFVWWMEGIRWDKLQSSWKIEEEGYYKKIFVYPVDDRYLRLVVVKSNDGCTAEEMFYRYALPNDTLDDDVDMQSTLYEERHIVLDTIVRKEELIAQFYYGFKYFVKNDFQQKKWSDENLHETLQRLDRTFDCNWDRWRGIYND